MPSEIVTIGMDDIDSPNGGCTTHFTSLLVELLESRVDNWLDYPNLIRLNPNIPYRTRGNGAVSLKFEIDSSEVAELLPTIKKMVTEYAEISYPNTNPGVVLCKGEISQQLVGFSKKALWRTIPISLANRLLQSLNLSYYAEGNMRGTIGALAAIGHSFGDDYTYEYIAYREMESCNDPRGVDPISVIEMNELMEGKTFANIDDGTQQILIEPQGPDPVLYGIRGNQPEDVIKAASMVRSKQPVDRWMIFRTNQATSEHLQNHLKIGQLRPYMSSSVSCQVKEKPSIIEGGHVIFEVLDDTAAIDCAAYEPTDDFRWIVSDLMVGDRIIVHAGVRPASRTHGMTLNLEGLQIIELARPVQVENPHCEKCGRRMKSAGKNKGFKCVKCGHKDAHIKKQETHINRDLKLGIYLPPASAQRHLTRPPTRFGVYNEGPVKMIARWHNP
ncbi:MAG: TiaS agmantine-binding domain-containing protein [Candidatus Thorarchaeota archaeon]|jgi:tRNA(Ile2)-agmatinylcytidine synthase